MQKRRLLKLAEFLDKLPSKRFNIGRWILEYTLDENQEIGCGTVACAMGWACTIPAFRRLGLRLKRKNNGDLIPTLGIKEGLDAAAKLFGIEYRVAFELFIHAGYPYDKKTTPKMVAKKIRKLVETGSTL